jgi:tRNA wybutosine-synthesizing protein 4
MANVYAQINGSKKFFLFPPSDATNFAFPPGGSSSSIDVFSSTNAAVLQRSHPHEADVNEGDALFIPSLWLHAATPTTDTSVAVNVFFRNLDHGYSLGRDVYGNRDLAAYEKGRQDLARIGASFEQFPMEVKEFYLTRLAEELRAIAKD